MSDRSAIPPRAYRDCAGEFATGVTVVIAEHDGEAAGMTLNSFASVSLDPDDSDSPNFDPNEEKPASPAPTQPLQV